jgi:8-oxo-dGTP pyrophosphatase MutT (NUDIX family)
VTRPRYQCAGGVVIDAAGRVLLREVAGHHKGYVWTFPKGRVDEGETVEACAVREVREETGVDAEILVELPGVRGGLESDTTYFVMRKIAEHGDHDAETSAVRWARPATAAGLLSLTEHASGRARDVGVLVDAVTAWIVATSVSGEV